MKKILMGAFFCFLGVSLLGAGTIRVLAPAGGENLPLRSSFVIQWEATDVSGNFNLVLMREGETVGRIATRLPSSTRSFTWRVGDLVSGSAAAGSGYRVRVAEVGGAGSIGQSNGTFSIVPISGPVIPSLEMRTAERAGGSCDYSVESLTFRDRRGSDVMLVNNERLFPYNGVATPGTAIIRIRWNGSPARPPDPPCEVPVEVGLRYLADRSRQRLVLGSYDTGPFDREGICQVSVPFVIRAGERADAEVNIDACLLPRRASCDANARNNSLAWNLRLRASAGDHDLQVQIVQDMGLRRIKPEMARLGWQVIGFTAAFKVRDFPRGPAEPVTSVRCRWSILRKGDDGRWEDATLERIDRYVTIPSVGSSDWVTKDIESEFWVRLNYWEGLQFVVEVDCDNRIPDTDRRNNRRDLSFSLVGSK